ncbi:hypothetical protein AVEN_14013-1 [Araneus ventricosus]|uniref:Uncharacterized protein n=1 Tax=Araneus ventricosus TaxID=182803 RepID=A0A4Y2QAZ7_ARAVE|nr:hypothetical protein AVEN_14013-1 [Araneus ventricosus]
MPVTKTFFSTDHFCLTERVFRDYYLHVRWCTTSHCPSRHCFPPLWKLLGIVPTLEMIGYRAHFGDDRVISRSFLIAWPPRSSGLNSCYFWLWRFLKDYVYGGSIWTLPELKASITCHVSAIDRESLCLPIKHALTMCLTQMKCALNICCD